MISIVYPTREKNEKHRQHLLETCGLNNVQIIEYVSNGEYSLTNIYNKALNETYSSSLYQREYIT